MEQRDQQLEIRLNQRLLFQGKAMNMHAIFDRFSGVAYYLTLWDDTRSCTHQEAYMKYLVFWRKVFGIHTFTGVLSLSATSAETVREFDFCAPISDPDCPAYKA